MLITNKNRVYPRSIDSYKNNYITINKLKENGNTDNYLYNVLETDEKYVLSLICKKNNCHSHIHFMNDDNLINVHVNMQIKWITSSEFYYYYTLNINNDKIFLCTDYSFYDPFRPNYRIIYLKNNNGKICCYRKDHLIFTFKNKNEYRCCRLNINNSDDIDYVIELDNGKICIITNNESVIKLYIVEIDFADIKKNYIVSYSIQLTDEICAIFSEKKIYINYVINILNKIIIFFKDYYLIYDMKHKKIIEKKELKNKYNFPLKINNKKIINIYNIYENSKEESDLCIEYMKYEIIDIYDTKINDMNFYNDIFFNFEK